VETRRQVEGALRLRLEERLAWLDLRFEANKVQIGQDGRIVQDEYFPLRFLDVLNTGAADRTSEAIEQLEHLERLARDPAAHKPYLQAAVGDTSRRSEIKACGLLKRSVPAEHGHVPSRAFLPKHTAKGRVKVAEISAPAEAYPIGRIRDDPSANSGWFDVRDGAA
jgi:hypothetical protein